MTVTAGTLGRAAALGAATGCRTTMGLTALSLSTPPVVPGRTRRLQHPAARLAVVTAAAGELTADKLPNTPSRAEPPGLAPRALLAVAGGAGVARRRREAVVPAVLAGLAGAAAAVSVGLWWRTEKAPELGLSPIVAALAEDVAAALAAFVAVRGT